MKALDDGKEVREDVTWKYVGSELGKHFGKRPDEDKDAEADDDDHTEDGALFDGHGKRRVKNGPKNNTYKSSRQAYYPRPANVVVRRDASESYLVETFPIWAGNKVFDISLKPHTTGRTLSQWRLVDEAAITSAALPAVIAVNDGVSLRKARIDDVDQTTAKEEIVQGVLGAGEFSLFVAKPGMGKSVLVGDIGLHIAAGKEWHGRKVKPGLVVFFAAERKRLTERRVAAWRKKHNVTGIPFVVVGGKLDLTTSLIDAKTLAATIKTLEEKSGHQCVLVILDTVTRTFGPGDQHQSRDMQRYVQSVDELHRATTAHIAAIHHSPWSDDRGKGAIDLDGAIDVSFVVNVVGTGPTKVFTLSCTGANDGDEGVITSFRLESVSLGADAGGNETTAPVVVQAEVVPDGFSLKGQSAKVFESLERAIEAHGECPPDGSPGFPDGVVTVTRDQWRNQFYADTRAKVPNMLEGTLRQRFTRANGELLDAGKIGATGERVWIALHA